MRRLWLPSVCAVLQVVSLTIGHGVSPAPGAAFAADLVGIASGLALFARRRRPILVLLLGVLGYVVQGVLAGPPTPAVLVVMTYLVVRRAGAVDLDPLPPRWAVGAVALATSALVVVGAASGQPYSVAPYAVLVLGAAALGLLNAARAAREDARRRELLDAQRLSIARDLHDIVGHGMGAITVQAGAARLAVAAGASDDATNALREIEAAGRGLLREVRWLVGLLREHAGTPGLGEVPSLIDNARRSGLEVSFGTQGLPAVVDPEVGEATYRILQEALTNVLRHADAGDVDVQLRVDRSVTLCVSNTGIAGQVAEGNGVRGMRERASSVGGDVHVGPVDGAWQVRAELPAARRR